MGKLTFVVGAGLGYVLGTRAGRAQYEKIKKASSKVWDNPRVQQNVQKVESRVTELARERGSAGADKVASTVKDRLHRGGDQSATGQGYAGGDAGQAAGTTESQSQQGF